MFLSLCFYTHRTCSYIHRTCILNMFYAYKIHRTYKPIPWCDFRPWVKFSERWPDKHKRHPGSTLEKCQHIHIKHNKKVRCWETWEQYRNKSRQHNKRAILYTTTEKKKKHTQTTKFFITDSNTIIIMYAVYFIKLITRNKFHQWFFSKVGCKDLYVKVQIMSLNLFTIHHFQSLQYEPQVPCL